MHHLFLFIFRLIQMLIGPVALILDGPLLGTVFSLVINLSLENPRSKLRFLVILQRQSIAHYLPLFVNYFGSHTSWRICAYLFLLKFFYGVIAKPLFTLLLTWFSMNALSILTSIVIWCESNSIVALFLLDMCLLILNWLIFSQSHCHLLVFLPLLPTWDWLVFISLQLEGAKVWLFCLVTYGVNV